MRERAQIAKGESLLLRLVCGSFALQRPAIGEYHGWGARAVSLHLLETYRARPTCIQPLHHLEVSLSSAQ